MSENGAGNVDSKFLDSLADLILFLTPEDGATIGNGAMMALLREQMPALRDANYAAARDALVDEGFLGRGRGRGGSIYRTGADDVEDEDGGEEDDGFALTATEEVSPRQRTGRKGFVSLEGQLFNRKSLQAATGKTAGWNEIAKDCFAFANAASGCLLPGIAGGQREPLVDQRIPDDLPDTLGHKLAEYTLNGTVLPDVMTAANGSQYIELRIPRTKIDTARCKKLLPTLPATARVAASVKEKFGDEMLDHYQFAQGLTLTNLGALCLGRQNYRSRQIPIQRIETGL